MFSKKSYFEVNREERHFGFLFASALIHNFNFRAAIFEKYNSITNAKLIAASREFNVYMEVTALRDFWNDMYPKNKAGQIIYTDQAEVAKRKVLKRILDFIHVDSQIIDSFDVFWTGTSAKEGKLWSPSQWDVKKLIEIEKIIKLSPNQLVQIRWAFNAKPDILINSMLSAVMIEVKLESNDGKSNSGYAQLPTQRLIATLMSELIPEFNGVIIKQACLALSDRIGSDGNYFDGLSWKEVIDTLENTVDHDEGSKYILKCLKEIKRYYN